VTRRREILLDCLLLFLLASSLVRPYYLYKYVDRWPSIESTFISDARFLADHWPHPRWQPLWYTGTRFDYVYPPALRYGTAALTKVFGWFTAKSYHFYTMFFYCVGIAGVYLLVRLAGRARWTAYVAAMAAGLLSPSLFFMKDMRGDAGPWRVPVRFSVLTRYGEGPHITALCLLPIALAFTWYWLDGKQPRALVLAAVFCAAVVSNNFYGATSLAIFFPLLLWSFFVTRGDRRALLPALTIPLLAYGLTAFWLTPSYLRVTLHNMEYVSDKGHAWSVAVAAVVLVAYGFGSYKLAARRKERTWAVFVAGSVLFFTLNVLGNYYADFRVIGEPGRLVPELDLVFILGAVMLLEWMWRRRGPWLKLVVAAVAIVAFASSRHYIKHSHELIQRWDNYQSRVEYRVTDWLWKNQPNARVLTSGTVRFWFDTWHDLAEMGGGSEQGLLNGVPYDVDWEIMLGTEPELSQLWLQAMGVDLMYVAGPKSQEFYKDVQNQSRFDQWPLLWDDGQGNQLRGTGRRFAPRARVVDTAALKALPALNDRTDIDHLRPYVNVIEHGPDSPATIERPSTDAMLVHANVAAGQSLLVQESWDPAWQATLDGKSLPVRKDEMGFMVIDPPPGNDAVRLEFPMPLENRVGWGLTGLTVVGLALLAWQGRFNAS
jgi:hypothetical protein